MARKTKQPIDMSELFSKSTGTLSQIKSKTNSLSLISDIVRQICPDLPVDVWQVGNISADTMIIEVKSAVWSQRFQFERNNIANALQQQTNGLISKIEIKVNPFNNRVQIEPNQLEKTQFISQSTASHLLEVAENAPESLKNKLKKLATLANKKDK